MTPREKAIEHCEWCKCQDMTPMEVMEEVTGKKWPTRQTWENARRAIEHKILVGIKSTDKLMGPGMLPPRMWEPGGTDIKNGKPRPDHLPSARDRTCLGPTCEVVFRSEGAHHRFCYECRRRNRGADLQPGWEYAVPLSLE